MPLKHLILAVTIGLITSVPAMAEPSLTVASEAPIADFPTGDRSFIPTDRLQDNEPGATRGILCKPGQDAEDCDDRTPMRSSKYPWSAIGRLQIGETGHCTGTIIDESWVLTNAHCVIDMKTHKITTKPLAFLPNLIDGKLQSDDDRAKIIKVIVGTDFSDSDRIPNANDWAMVKLDRPLGKKYGTIGWKALPSNLLIKNTKKFTLVGYSFDFPSTEKYGEFSAGPSFTAGIHKGCSFTSEQKDKVLVHSCDMRAGASGSAILAWVKDQPYIVAINNAELTNRRTGEAYENYAVNVNRINEWFTQQQANVKTSQKTTTK
jgi:V8-like Glu-specific endopeptidase